MRLQGLESGPCGMKSGESSADSASQTAEIAEWMQVTYMRLRVPLRVSDARGLSPHTRQRVVDKSVAKGGKDLRRSWVACPS